MPIGYRAEITPPVPAPARPAPSRRARLAKALVLVLMTVPAFAAWRELEPLLLFRPVQAVCVWADMRPATVTMQSRSGLRRQRSGFVPEVVFRYQVGGVEYASSTFARMPRLESRQKVRRRMDGVLTGLNIRAWHNPFHPSEAVIDRSPNPIWLSILAVVGVFAGLLWMSIGASERKRGVARTPEPRQDVAA